MPFEKGEATRLHNWKPSEDFNPASDRLLVTTTLGDSFVVCGGPAEDDGTTLIIDPELMPQNLASVPDKLRKKRTFPFEWNPSVHPWRIYVFDGYAPHPELFAAGVGWTLCIMPGFTLTSIQSIELANINRKQLAVELGGLYANEYTINESALYEEAFRQLQQTLEST